MTPLPVLPPLGETTALDLTMADIRPWPGATIEQVRDAFLEGRVAAVAATDRHRKTTDPMLKAAIEDARDAVRTGKMIDAGFLPNAVIKAESKRAKNLILEGWIGHPFGDPWVLFHTWEDGAAPLLVIPADDDGKVTLIVEFIPCYMRDARFLVVGDVAELTAGAERDGEPGFRAQITSSPMRLMAAGMDEPDEAMLVQAACNCGDPIWTVLAMLATDGVQTERIPAPERLNRQRAAKGKYPIPARLRVLSAPYITALAARRAGKRSADAAPGTHASPVMHIRRGHPRTLPTGRRVWVRDCIINAADDSPVVRSHYAMKPGPESKT